MRIGVVIPALDEEDTIGPVVTEMTAAVERWGARSVAVIVADNGSADATWARAQQAGAQVVRALPRGYGAACLAGIDALPPGTDVVVFCDGDGADDPRDLPALLDPIVEDDVELVIGSRALGERLGMCEPGAVTTVQRFGNELATGLIRVIFGVVFSDLGPFRAIQKSALDRLALDDMNFGWTVQMQARAARRALSVVDVPVHYRRRRGGRSKVSGNLVGASQAGAIILRTIAQEAALGLLGR